MTVKFIRWSEISKSLYYLIFIVILSHIVLPNIYAEVASLKSSNTLQSSHQLRLSIFEPKLSSSTWSLIAKRAILNNHPIRLKMTEIKYVPCLSLESLLHVRAKSADYNSNHLILRSPTLHIGSLQIPLPKLLLDPTHPKIGDFKIILEGRDPWIELGFSWHTALGSLTPTLIHRAKGYGGGLKLETSQQQIHTQFLQRHHLNQSSFQFEGKGGHQVFSVRGGMVIQNKYAPMFSSALLNPIWYQRPLRLDGKLTIYEDSELIMSIGHQTVDIDRIDTPTQHSSYGIINWNKQIHPTTAQWFSVSLQALNRFIGRVDDDLPTIYSAHSFALNPTVYNIFGASHAFLVSDFSGTAHYRPTYWMGLEHAFRFANLGPKSLHSIHLTPRFWSNIQRSNNQQGLIPYQKEAGLLLSQSLNFQGYLTDIDIWWGHRLIDRLSQVDWSYRLRFRSPSLLIDHQHHTQTLNHTWLTYQFNKEQVDTTTGYISIAKHHFENLQNYRLSNPFTPLHLRGQQLSQLFYKHSLLINQDAFSSHISQVEGALTYKAFTFNLGWWGRLRSVLKKTNSLAYLARATWRQLCQCWYIQVSGGRRSFIPKNEYTSSSPTLDWVMSVSFGLGDPKGKLGFSPSFDF